MGGGVITVRRALVVLAVAATACSAGSVEVARVGDESISKQDVLELRNTYGDHRASGSAFRDDLARVIFQEIVAQALGSQYGVLLTADEIDAETTRVLSEIAEQGQSLEQVFGPGATEVVARRNVSAILLRDRAVAALSSDVEILTPLVEADPLQFSVVCVRHILVASAQEAEEVIGLLDAGEPFAGIADEVSLDAAPGGDLGCSAPSRYVPEFAAATLAAPIGSTFGPVQTQFGFHVLVVDDRNELTPEAIEEDPSAFVPQELGGQLFIDWFNEVVRSADVTIASEVGSWSEDGLGIDAPPSGGD